MLRVYGATAFIRGVNGQQRAIVATTSQKKAAEFLGISFSEFRNTGTETFNREEVALASAEPGVVFYHQLNGDRSWKRL